MGIAANSHQMEDNGRKMSPSMTEILIASSLNLPEETNMITKRRA